MRGTILLVDGKSSFVLTLSDRLREEGYAVKTACNSTEGVKRATRKIFDLIILDVRLPGKDGLEACRNLRKRGVATPILMLTARGRSSDKARGLKAGADDYLTKPFGIPELLARVEALLRRSPVMHAPTPQPYQIGSVQVDLRRTQVLRGGERVSVSAKEFRMLRYLLEHRGTTVSREELLQKVWGYSSAPSSRTVDVHVAWLRKKLEDDPARPAIILTVRGLGYKLAD